MIVSAIAAMSLNRAIGKGNALPWHIPTDLKHFRDKTRGKPVIMGRKTFDSIGHALPGRPNLVITRQPGWSAPGAETYASIHAAIQRAHELAPGEQDEVFIVGGAEIYRETLPLWDRVYLTVVEAQVEGDAFFPELGSGFKLVQSLSGQDGEWSFRFEDWVRS